MTHNPHSRTKAHSHTQVVGHTHEVPPPPDMPPAVRKQGTGCCLAVFGYFILSFFSVLAMGSFVWVLLIFLVVPVLTGISTGRLQRSTVGPEGCFWAGMRAAGIPMWFYTAISLMFVHSRVGPSADAFATFVVGVGVATTYALIAGLVSGTTALLIARQQK